MLDGEPKPAPIVAADILAGAQLDAAAPAAGDPAAPGAAPAPAIAIDWNKESADFVDFCKTLFFPLSPSIADVYTDDVRSSIAAKLAPVLAKYNFNLARLFGQYGDEIMLGAVLLPLVPATIAAVRKDNHERKNGKTIDAPKTEATPPGAGGRTIAAAGDGGNDATRERFPGLAKSEA